MHSASAPQAGCTAMQRFRNAVVPLRNTRPGRCRRSGSSPGLAQVWSRFSQPLAIPEPAVHHTPPDGALGQPSLARSLTPEKQAETSPFRGGPKNLLDSYNPHATFTPRPHGVHMQCFGMLQTQHIAIACRWSCFLDFAFFSLFSPLRRVCAGLNAPCQTGLEGVLHVG